jgi:hypothetical protein
MNRFFRIAFYLLLLFVLLSFFSKDFRELPLKLGFITIGVPISGTGSMYPTFPKGTGTTDQQRAEEIVATPQMYVYPSGIRLLGRRLFGYSIQAGDIVVIDNAQTSKITTEI